MKTIEINGTLRAGVGKKDTKQLRKEGNVPCVIYGGKENVHFYALEKEFKNLIYTPNEYLLKIKIGKKEYNAIMQDVQFHPVKDTILHIDFLEFTMDNPIIHKVPVQLNGFAKGVQAGGKLNLDLRKLKVRALAKDFPEKIEIDVTDIGLGKSIKVVDLNFDNLELLDPASNVIASVKLTRAARGAAGVGEEGEEGEEGATEEAAE